MLISGVPVTAVVLHVGGLQVQLVYLIRRADKSQPKLKRTLIIANLQEIRRQMSTTINSEIKIPSLGYILSRTSDEKSIDLFDSIANSKDDKSNPSEKGEMTAKQYYSRITKLMSAGLIKKYKGRYSLTLLGRVVYYSLMTMRNTIDNQPMLRTI